MGHVIYVSYSTNIYKYIINSNFQMMLHELYNPGWKIRWNLEIIWVKFLCKQLINLCYARLAHLVIIKWTGIVRINLSIVLILISMDMAFHANTCSWTCVIDLTMKSKYILLWNHLPDACMFEHESLILYHIDKS